MDVEAVVAKEGRRARKGLLVKGTRKVQLVSRQLERIAARKGKVP